MKDDDKEIVINTIIYRNDFICLNIFYLGYVCQFKVIYDFQEKLLQVKGSSAYSFKIFTT